MAQFQKLLPKDPVKVSYLDCNQKKIVKAFLLQTVNKKLHKYINKPVVIKIIQVTKQLSANRINNRLFLFLVVYLSQLKLKSRLYPEFKSLNKNVESHWPLEKFMKI